MTPHRTIASILDETIVALSNFDGATLESLEQQIGALSLAAVAVEVDAAGMSAILKKKRTLELLLQNCEVNLDGLKRLHARNRRAQWAQ